MFDLVILGSGSAAFAAALKSADHGAKAAMIERSTLGGTCVNVGCVPSKNLLRAGELRYYDSHRDFPGMRPGRTTLEFSRIIEQKNQIVRGLRKEKYSDVLRSLPSTKLFRGNARFVSRTRVKVDGINVDGKRFVIATGSSPRIPSIPGIKSVDYLTNVEALSLRNKPASMVVLGGRALGLEIVPVGLRKDGAVKVDREMHTTARYVWAAGDVIGEPMLETIAAKEGATAAENALLGTHRKIDFLPVPRAIFTSPQVASVGLTEKQAHEQGYECTCRTIPMSKVPKAVVIRDTRGLVKMVADSSTGRILGVHILANDAADIIQEAVLAVKYKLTIDDVIDTVHVFPTMTESIKLAATSFRRDIDQLSCCAEEMPKS